MKAINALIDDYITEVITILNAYGQFGQGNFEVNLKQYSGKKSLANEKFDQLKSNIQSVNIELSSLIASVLEGKMDSRVDTSHYSGDWKSLMERLNMLLQVISEPINEANEVLAMLSTGNFNITVSKKYKGNFAEMMNSFDRMITSIASYITEITEVLDSISKGDLAVSINRKYDVQFDLIKNSINHIALTLKTTMLEIKTSADSMLMSANKVSETASDLASGASIQAGTVEELSSSVTEINEHMFRTAEQAQAASQISQQSIQSAKEGSQEMLNMLTAMDDIKNASLKISNVIKLIDDIAFQTNLLALNAAVEAARAGEHGKGFAVVASEVHSLAARCSHSAKDTTALIEDAIGKIQVGTNKANASSESFKKIVSSIDSVCETINQIQVDTKKQSNRVSMISIGINQISQVTQSNSATSEESAATSQELMSMASVLNKLVSQFSLQ